MDSNDPIIREYKDSKSKYQERLEEMEYLPLRIAVTGQAGAGKSSFVNAFRGVSDEDEEAAEVGTVERTSEPKAYRHPSISKIKIWDLPRIGTSNFNAEEYLNQVKFEKYDVFVIVASHSFVENEALLAKKIKRKGKVVYYVRTKIDVTLEAARPKTNFNEEKKLAEIRKYCEDDLRRATRCHARVFLVSNHHRHLYDFPTLKEKLAVECPKRKKLILTLVLEIFSEENLEKKKEKMKHGIKKHAWTSGTIGAVPIPGPSLLSDIGIFLHGMRCIRNEFGLNERTLRFLAIETETEYEELKSAVKKTPLVINKEFLLYHLTKSTAWAAVTFAETIADFCLLSGLCGVERVRLCSPNIF